MDLYSAVLTTAPFILMTITGGIVFGPAPVVARHRDWKLPKTQLAIDASGVLCVLAGALVALIVLGGVWAPTPTWRAVTMWSGGLSLLFVTLHVLGEIGGRYLNDRVAHPPLHPEPASLGGGDPVQQGSTPRGAAL